MDKFNLFFALLNANLFLGKNSKILPAHEEAAFINDINFRWDSFKSVPKDL